MPLISTAQAAKRLGVSTRRVVAMITSGRLPAQKISRAWVIDSADLRHVQARRPGRPRKPRGK